jgi:hypothetical protein
MQSWLPHSHTNGALESGPDFGDPIVYLSQ